MRIEDFFKLNHPVDMDEAYGYQCMDLYNYYCKEVLGLEGVGADRAKNILNNPKVRENFEIIDNYLEFIPQTGDVAIWCGGQYGHVAICYGQGDINGFKTKDQNWKPQQLTDEWHDYTYLAPLKFLRPKNQTNIKPIPQPESQPEPVKNEVKVGDIVKVLRAIQYNGEPFKTWYDVYEVIEIVRDRVVIGVDGVVTCAINIKDIEKI